MDDHFLNVVSLNIPYPPNYGGIIDIYYKLKALKRLGVHLILHCFEYERPEAPELEEICEKVYYYKRHTGLLANMSLLPYNVVSRKEPKLMERLLENDYPILFEGLHCCYYMADPRLKGRKKIYRECNIEHDYYRYLAHSTRHLIRTLFYRIEAWRFFRYQTVVRHADLVIAVSRADQAYLCTQFPDKQIDFIPCFHENNEIRCREGASEFILYHGKLSVEENEKAALFLIREVFRKLPYTCVIAGMNPSKKLLRVAAPYPNIRVEANPDKHRMEELIREAQINTLITFQDTGLKLKLLNSLFAGRHILVNPLMLAGSGLEPYCARVSDLTDKESEVEPLCLIANTPTEMIQACKRLMRCPFSKQAIQVRKNALFPTYSNQAQGERLFNLIFDGEHITV